MPPDLETTNVLLAVMAVVSVLEALVLIGLVVGGFMIYRHVMQTLGELETRQVAPLRERVEAILTDVKAVTARVSQQTERVDHAITGTIDRVDETTERVKSSVREQVTRATGVLRAIRAVIISVLSTEGRPEPPATAAGGL
jgi:hypothetical protein